MSDVASPRMTIPTIRSTMVPVATSIARLLKYFILFDEHSHEEYEHNSASCHDPEALSDVSSFYHVVESEEKD